MPQESSASVTRTAALQAFDLKGAVSTLTVLKLRTEDLELIEADLWERVEQAPQMLLNAPVVIDVGALVGGGAGIDFHRLVAVLRRCQVVPVAAANLPAELKAGAARAGLGSIPLSPARARRSTTVEPVVAPEPAVAEAAPEPAVAEAAPAVDVVETEPAVEIVEAAAVEAEAAPEPEAEPAPEPEAHVIPAPTPTTTVLQPVRGGQVVYARRGDLVVMAAVNPGAQVIADGHIHIYGPLRGRALAGATGNTAARIFCQQLTAELVSVAGVYLMADEIPEALRGKPAQVFQKDGRCCVAPL